MRHLSLVSLLFGLCSWHSANAQWKRGFSEMLIPKIAPLTLFDPYTPGASIGFEFQPHDNWSVQLEYNLPFPYLAFFNHNAGKINHQTRRMRAEIRIYPGMPSDAAAWYLAGEGFFVQERYKRENSTLFRDGALYNFTESRIERDVIGGALKAGYQFTINYFMVIDAFAGLGMRYVQLEHSPEALFPTPILFDERWGGDQREGNFLRPHLALGIRLGISLYQRY
ncbi:MAG: DUF3575 domain-containing protein [Bacteroidia bacterium]